MMILKLHLMTLDPRNDFFEVIRIKTNDIPINIKSLKLIRQGTTNSIDVSPNPYFICLKSRILYTLSDILTPL